MKNLKRFFTPVLILVISILAHQTFQYYPNLDERTIFTLKKALSILIIISITWTLIAFLNMMKIGILKNYDLNEEDNLKSRKLYTQFNILEKIIIFILIIIAIGTSLMLFDNVKKIGISLFASAGISGIIIGFAAQKLIATILAGIQIALTQPIRLDDVVIVENEWGWIEEITLTYVVVRIWDKRRLVVPSTYFIEKPFQNWTRSTSEILGTVFIYTDYTMNIEALRKELTRLLKSTPLWDGQVNVLQVTDAKQSTLEVRALMSAKNSPTAWDLRVFIREKLIQFMQYNYPESLPKTRIEINNIIDDNPIVGDELLN